MIANKNNTLNEQKLVELAAQQIVDLFLLQARFQRENTEPKKLNKSKNQYETKRTN